jgi:hypothetical protein
MSNAKLRVIQGGNPDGKIIYKKSRFSEAAALEVAWQTLSETVPDVYKKMSKNHYFNVCVLHFSGGPDCG